MLAILNDTYIAEGRRMVVATVDGQRYEIPEIWLRHYCDEHDNTTPLDAAVAWHEMRVLNDPIMGSRDLRYLEAGGQ